MGTPAVSPEVPLTPSPGPVACPPAADQGRRDVADAAIQNFSIVLGGPAYDLLLRMGLLRFTLPNVLRRIVLLVALTWLPLLLLSLRDGLAFGHEVRIPLLYDLATYGRLLLCLPLLIVAEIVIDPAIRLSVSQFVQAGIVQNDVLPKFDGVLMRIQKLRDSKIPEFLLLGLAFFPVFLFEHEWTAGAVSSWHTTAKGLTPAGWWYAFFSAPLLRFIIYRWAFRYFVWSALLRRICRLDLVLMPTHPDRAAGLNFLSITQQRFGILFCALGFSFAGRMANSLVFEGAKIESFQSLMIGFVVMSLIVSLLPLALMTPKLMMVRWKGLLEYGRLANAYTQDFDRKWVHRTTAPAEPLLGTSDIQSLADMGNSFSFVNAMMIAPINKGLVLQLAAQAALPLLPVILIGTPAPELIKAVIKMVA
jgi:hypothetical protein